MNLIAFHFIRPWWLLALIPAAVIAVILWRQRDSSRIWGKIIAKNLLPHLLVSDAAQHSRIRPHVLLTIVLFGAIVAAAGPTWKRQPSPFVEDTAALVIALEVTPTMLAQDIQPTRLDRAAHKISDLLERRRGAKTALIAYAGTAHLVMPLTNNPSVIADFAQELSPELMPVEGDAPSQAMAIAKDLLDSAGLAGSILLITDSVPPQEIELIAAARDDGAPKAHLLAVAAGPEVTPPADSPPAPPLDVASLKSAAKAAGGDLVIASADDRDVERVTRSIETNFSPAAASDSEDARWIDYGYWLLPFLAAACLMWFRSGWIVPHSAAFILASLWLTGAPANAQSAGSSLWKTPDQQAQKLFDAGEFAAAAERFTDPMRQGVAWYRAGEFEKAAASFGRTTSAEGAYNRGNALLMMGNYIAAIASYETALKTRPDWEAAKSNRDLAEARLKAKERPDGITAKEKLTRDDAPDEYKFDLDKNAEGAANDQIAGAGKQMDDMAMRQIWLRQIETKPADFLRAKFAFQRAKAEAMGEENP